MTGHLQRWVAYLRHPERAERTALVLWLVWAVVVWNVIFDRVLVLAGRRFVYEAAVAAASGRPYLSAGDWMREASRRGVWLATPPALVLAGLGVLLVRWGRSRRRATRSA